jgi:hypothetical protein
MEIEIYVLTAALVRRRLDELTRMNAVLRTDDEQAEFSLWAKLQAAMEAEGVPDLRCAVALWRDEGGPRLTVRAPFGWADENLKPTILPEAIQVAVARRVSGVMISLSSYAEGSPAPRNADTGFSSYREAS